MRSSNTPFPIGVDTNPLVTSLYNYREGSSVPLPPSANKGITTENGAFITTESGFILITET